jgi:hypothetical protein
MMIATTGSPLANPVPERERLMAHYGIHYDGTGYRYDGYRYAHLAGAVRYAGLAGLQRAQDAGGPPLQPGSRPALTAADHALMGRLGIAVDGGGFRFRDYRYDSLAGALSYARVKSA